jgi:hypothetical protein
MRRSERALWMHMINEEIACFSVMIERPPERAQTWSDVLPFGERGPRGREIHSNMPGRKANATSSTTDDI